MNLSLRKLYLYLFSAIGLIMVVVAVVNVTDLGLRSYVFTKADDIYYAPYPGEVTDPDKISEEEKRMIADKQSVAQKQREISNAIAMLLVGVPLYLYHWKTIQKDA